MAAVGEDTDHVVVILPDESADSVVASADAAASASAKQTSEIAAAERMGMQFYTYAASATTTITPEPEPEPTVPMMTNIEYYNNIHNTPLIPADCKVK